MKRVLSKILVRRRRRPATDKLTRPRTTQSKTSLALAALLLSLLTLVGCDPAFSIHTLYADKEDVVFEPNLLGTWVTSENGGDPVIIERGDSKAYQIRLQVGDRTSSETSFTAYLVNVSGYLFLDAVANSSQNSARDSFAIPGHVIVRIWLTNDSLRLAYLDESGVSEGGPAGGTHIEACCAVLTGSTLDLKRFVVEHANDDTVFDQNADEMHRLASR